MDVFYNVSNFPVTLYGKIVFKSSGKMLTEILNVPFGILKMICKVPKGIVFT